MTMKPSLSLFHSAVHGSDILANTQNKSNAAGEEPPGITDMHGAVVWTGDGPLPPDQQGLVVLGVWERGIRAARA